MAMTTRADGTIAEIVARLSSEMNALRTVIASTGSGSSTSQGAQWTSWRGFIGTKVVREIADWPQGPVLVRAAQAQIWANFLVRELRGQRSGN